MQMASGNALWRILLATYRLGNKVLRESTQHLLLHTVGYKIAVHDKRNRMELPASTCTWLPIPHWPPHDSRRFVHSQGLSCTESTWDLLTLALGSMGECAAAAAAARAARPRQVPPPVGQGAPQPGTPPPHSRNRRMGASLWHTLYTLYVTCGVAPGAGSQGERGLAPAPVPAPPARPAGAASKHAGRSRALHAPTSQAGLCSQEPARRPVQPRAGVQVCTQRAAQRAHAGPRAGGRCGARERRLPRSGAPAGRLRS
jgi:hypothetical protein